jgi:hypothetical protein
MPQRISQLTALVDPSLIGPEHEIEVSFPNEDAAFVNGTTFSAQASDNSFNDSASGFVAGGFSVGDNVRVTGFTSAGNNLRTGIITALTAAKMTIGGADGDSIVDEAAGDNVLIRKWVTARMSMQELQDYSPIQATAGAVPVAAGVATIDCTVRRHVWDLDQNITDINFTNLPSSRYVELAVLITQDTTARTITWPAAVQFPAGMSEAVSTGAGARDKLTLATFDGGATWLAALAKGYA